MPRNDNPLLAALSGKATGRPPIWLMRQAGRHLPEYCALRRRASSFLDFCYTPELAVEASLQPVRRYRLDAAIVFSDILVIPDALGQRVWFEQGTGPKLEPVLTGGEIDRLNPNRLTERLQPVYETVAGVRAELPAGTALIGFAGAPWTIATYMIEGGTSRDHERARALAYRAPRVVERLIEILTAAVVEHLLAQIRAGAEAVQIFDSWAGALPATLRERHSLRPIAEIAARIGEACPEVPVIAFPRGVGGAYADYAALAGIAAVSIDQTVDPRWAAAAVQPHAAVQGNLDPVLLAAGGRAMDEAVDGILAALGGGPFVFNLGHGVVPDTPPAHVETLIARVKGNAA
ncbi:MAG: uroporphyrinogen decarboxylase [Defluviicoccus sp.]|nr:uroporphyrinogen decarboxylase [Defluviicoccus sp.]MDE0384195.1 uroporphyrinogen decarboxylase [Defluviicoccus sp.]